MHANLGPLPEPDMSHEKARDDRDEETSYSAEAMEEERQRCYALGAAEERERIAKFWDGRIYGVGGMDADIGRSIRRGELVHWKLDWA